MDIQSTTLSAAVETAYAVHMVARAARRHAAEILEESEGRAVSEGLWRLLCAVEEAATLHLDEMQKALRDNTPRLSFNPITGEIEA